MTCPHCKSSRLNSNGIHGGHKYFVCRDCGKTSKLGSNGDLEGKVSTTETAPDAKPREVSDDIGQTSRTITTRSADITSLEELLTFSKVDLLTWEVERHVVNSWEVTMGKATTGTGKPQTYTNYQVKAWLRKRIGVDLRAEVEAAKNDAASHAYAYTPIRYDPPRTPGNMLEIALFDHHFGRLSWGQETGSGNYDAKISRTLALDSVRYLLGQSQASGIERILLTIGNDFFNVNSATNTTFAGTPQSEDGRWQKTFTAGRRLWTEIIELCMGVAPVDVLIIPGNHDRERTFYLGAVLEGWFSQCPQVAIDNAPRSRKYYEWGKCLIGFTHGKEEKKGALVNIMATEAPQEWSRTRYREWHKGHLHAANERAFQVLEEERGVRELVMPSLVDISDWEAGKGYAALRESIGSLWNKDAGKIATYMYHPAEEGVA